MAMLQKHVQELGEHFDTVHIFITRHEPGEARGTINASWASGNFFTRYGQIKHWLIKKEEETKIEVAEGEEE